ncbi:MAG: hypothetical protein RL595_1160 [Planctomycetota bacterium]
METTTVDGGLFQAWNQGYFQDEAGHHKVLENNDARTESVGGCKAQAKCLRVAAQIRCKGNNSPSRFHDEVYRYQHQKAKGPCKTNQEVLTPNFKLKGW